MNYETMTPKQKLIKQVVAQFARDMGEPYHNEEAIEDVLWDCFNEDVFRTYLRHQSEEYVEPTRLEYIKLYGGITRPIAERGKPMPDQSHLYIDCTTTEDNDDE